MPVIFHCILLNFLETKRKKHGSKAFYVAGREGHVGHVNFQLSIIIKFHVKYFPRDDSMNAVCMLLQYGKQLVFVMQGHLTHQPEQVFAYKYIR